MLSLCVGVLSAGLAGAQSSTNGRSVVEVPEGMRVPQSYPGVDPYLVVGVGGPWNGGGLGPWNSGPPGPNPAGPPPGPGFDPNFNPQYPPGQYPNFGDASFPKRWLLIGAPERKCTTGVCCVDCRWAASQNGCAGGCKAVRCGGAHWHLHRQVHAWG